MSSNVFKCFGPKQPGSDFDPSQYIVECNHCHKNVAGSNKSTSNLWTHIKY